MDGSVISQHARDRPKILKAMIIGWISHITACQRQTKDIKSNSYWMDQSQGQTKDIKSYDYWTISHRDRPKILKAIIIGWISHRDRPKILKAIVIGWISHVTACQR